MSDYTPALRHTLTAEQSHVPFAPDVLALLTGPDRYHVTSAALMDFMDEMERTGGFVYNSKAIAAWSLHHGLPDPGSYCGTPLSTLAYNCQQYRRARALERAGFVRGTQEMIDQCGRTGERLEFPSDGLIVDEPLVCRVRLVAGKLRAMMPQSRTRAAVVIGNMCKVVPAL